VVGVFAAFALPDGATAEVFRGLERDARFGGVLEGAAALSAVNVEDFNAYVAGDAYRAPSECSSCLLVV